MNKKVNSLCEQYRNYFPIGTSVNTKGLSSHKDLLLRHFNSVTAENAMKFSEIHPREDYYDFLAADELAELAAQHRLLMRGHTLVWHNQTPGWVFKDRDGHPAGADLLRQRISAHMQTVMNRYKERVYCWDVVNEAISEDDEMYRPSSWFQILGVQYIEEMFRLAQRLEPEALLFYNDYNATVPWKRDKIIRMLRGLLARETPVHGMGIQGHWNIYNFPPDEIRTAIQMYADLGLTIHITELDVSLYAQGDTGKLTHPPADALKRQAEYYDEVFSLFREFRDVISSVTLWGIADDATWLDNFPVVNRKNWPLLFAEDHQPKEAFYRISRF